MSTTTENTVGFWKHGKRLVSAWLRKGNIPKSCRLVLVENSYKKAGDKKPDFIGYFVDIKDTDAENIAHPYAVLRSQLEDEEDEEQD